MRRIEPYSDIFGTLHNLCKYNRAVFRTQAYLELEVSSKACRAYKMSVQFRALAYQNSLFKHFQGCLGIFRDINAYSAKLTGAELGGKVSWFGKERPWLCFWRNVYWSALVPQTPPPTHKNFWLRTCTLVLFFLQNPPS